MPAAAAYVLITFALAAPWYLFWFKRLYDDLGMYNRAEPIIALGVGSMVLQGTVMALLHPRQYRGGHTPGSQRKRAGIPPRFSCGAFWGIPVWIAYSVSDDARILP